PTAPSAPPPFDQLARISPEGDIQPTPQGVLMPGDFMLFAGRPDRVPAARPEAVTRAAAAAAPSASPAPTAAPGPDATEAPPAPYADPALKGFKPKTRPAAITAAAAAAAEQAAPAAQDAATPDATAPDDGAALPPTSPAEQKRLAALAEKKPKNRPAAIARAAAAQAEAESAAAAATAQAEAAAADPFAGATAAAVAVSRRPSSKPSTFKGSVERALAAAIAAEPTPTPVAVAAPAPAPKIAAKAPAPEEIDEPEPTHAAPKLPTSASVAKQATVKNGIQLGEMNLIGLYGASKSRRALIRMPNGKFVKVSVGDRLDGGKVTAIGEAQLTYQKGSRSYTLKLLKGS
ncbi:MAG: translation initiation factor 2, partial [Paracoccaceae bacterium]|nr:translation initiation factor 2 [Paracoccaceae bacterium]